MCASDKQWGLARDGTYLWTAGAGAIEVLELDCGLRWSVGGDLGDAKVLATAGAVNVYDVDLMPQSVVHLDALDGGQSSDAFVGAFANWFADAPRYWTTQGASYRIYDLDNTEVKLAPGAVQCGRDKYILSGSGTLRIGKDAVPLRAGAYVALPVSTEAHQLINTGDEVLRYLYLSTMHAADICVYPDSGKIGVFAGMAPGGDPAQRTLSLFLDGQATRAYWDGEDEGP